MVPPHGQPSLCVWWPEHLVSHANLQAKPPRRGKQRTEIKKTKRWKDGAGGSKEPFGCELLCVISVYYIRQQNLAICLYFQSHTAQPSSSLLWLTMPNFFLCEVPSLSICVFLSRPPPTTISCPSYQGIIQRKRERGREGNQQEIHIIYMQLRRKDEAYGSLARTLS